MNNKLPSEQLADLMEGRVIWDDAPKSIRSWAMFPIYSAANGILKMPKEKRRAAIDRAPVTVRPILEDQIKRLWKMQKSSA